LPGAVPGPEDLPFPDGTFDSVSVRFGYMFFAMAKVSAFDTDGRVRVPGVARCIVGTKTATTKQV
jgi:ubiquinone/menaquinone biosynthesis C-methylase UbiE